MKLLIKSAIIAAALGASAAASADTFDFTYLFADGQQSVTGSFTGTTADGGLSASNIGNLQVSFNGVAFSGGAGPLVLNSYTSGGTFNAPSASTTIYANAALNNFAVSDVDLSVNSSPDYYFEIVNDSDPAVGANAVAVNSLQTDAFSGAQGFQFDADSANGTWSMTDVSAVPVPATLPLMLSGLGLLGLARRRRAA